MFIIPREYRNSFEHSGVEDFLWQYNEPISGEDYFNGFKK